MSRITIVLSTCAVAVLFMSGQQWLSGRQSPVSSAAQSLPQADQKRIRDTEALLRGVEARVRLIEKRLGSVDDQPKSHEAVDAGESADPVSHEVVDHSAHEAHVDESHAGHAGLSSDACKKVAICTVGDAIQQQTAWNLPPGKYEGAHCRAPLLCNFGPKHSAFVGKKTAWHDVSDSHACPKYPNPKKVTLLPKWVAEAGGKRAQYTEIQAKLDIQDSCVEAWRVKHVPRARPCKRCHGIAQDLVLSRIYAELIARLPKCRRVCETGFNRGDSSIILSTACGHGSEGLSFSLDTRWYTRPGMACQSEAFAKTRSTNTIVEGFSTTSITDFIARNPAAKESCDVIMVDGIKTAHGRYQDLADLAPLAHRDTLWITDDVEVQGFTDKPRHCIHKVFYSFASEQGFDVRCWPTGSGGFMGQCYGYRDWDALLAGGGQ